MGFFSNLMIRQSLRSLCLLNTATNKTPRLTPRETKVLVLRREGKTYKEIALLLGISSSTVKFHVQSILQKTNTHSSAEAVYYFSQVELKPVHPASLPTSKASLRMPA